MPIEALTKRSTKGSRLTPAEMDGNWDKLTNFSNGLETRIGVSLNPDGTIADQKVISASTATGTDSYAISVSGTFAAIADLAGRFIPVQIDVPNTGPATLTVNAFAATAIKKQGTIDLASGDLKPGVAVFVYDPINGVFELINPAGNSKVNYGLTTNSTNDYTLTVSSLSSSSFEMPVAYYAGLQVLVKFNATNTGASRLKLVSTSPAIDLGFADIRKNATTVLTGGELLANTIYELVFDGTYWQMQGISSNISLLPGFYSATSGNDMSTNLHTFTHGLGAAPKLVRAVVICISVDAGFAVNDELDIASISDIGGDAEAAASVSVDPVAGTIIVGMLGSSTFHANPKGAGAKTAIAKTKWKPKVYAWL